MTGVGIELSQTKVWTAKNHTVDISGDVTDVGWTTNERTKEDRATQPLDAGRLSFATAISVENPA